ncbi:hypothetical protein ACKWTF_007176 [Chironomus riparius]
MKLLKIYLINCPNTAESQIYCIKHEKTENLHVLKEKIFLRCPSLKEVLYEPQIYWFDLECDKIMIACEDDLKFFLNESEVTKLIFDYKCYSQDSSRKRHLTDDESSESSRRIRRKLQEIDLDSESSMDTDELNEKDIESQIIPTQSIILTTEEQPVPSTSQAIQNDQNVNVLSVEIIQSADEVDGKQSDVNNEKTEKTANEEIAEIIEESNAQSEVPKKRKISDSNKIVISDSSDDEEDTRRNRRHSDGHYSSSYSFAYSGNGGRFEQRSSFDDNFRQFNHHRTYNQYRPRYRDEQFENMNRIFQNAQAMRENVLRNADSLRQNTIRNIRNSATILPQILSSFQSHFRPLFQQPGFNSQPRYPRNHRH